MRRASLLLLLLLCGLASPARGYEAASTHAGMTERAGRYQNRLHRWLRQVHGAPLGLYEPVRLDLSRLPPRERPTLEAHLRALDPALGYRPSTRGDNWAVGWLAAGAVLEDMPFSRGRHHFLDPRTGRGLHNATGHKALSTRLRTLDLLEGDGTLGGVFTGANFNLTGQSVLRWAHSRDNAYSLERHLAHRFAALTAPAPAARRHHLALALITAGALLHLLQDMAVPAHVRNDFVTTYLRRRSNLILDRVSLFEDVVRRRYGRAGVPPVRSDPPRMRTFAAFFTNPRGTGLADQIQRRFFSLGSLPRTQRRIQGLSVQQLLRRVQRALPYPFPRITRLALSAARAGGVYYSTRDNPHLFAYRITPRGQLEFTLDERCYRSAAERLVPEAVRYSAGLLAFLLRGALRASLKAGQVRIRYHAGPALAAGTATLLWENRRGLRRVLRRVPVGKLSPGRTMLSLRRSEIPKDAVWLVVAYQGRDAAGEPIVVGARRRLSGKSR